MKSKVNEYIWKLFMLGLIGFAELLNMLLWKRTEGMTFFIRAMLTYISSIGKWVHKQVQKMRVQRDSEG
jgi:hypothetical protein